MDEVDGMSAGDRGGVQELVRVIPKTRVPIICICNDRESPKVRTLASKCYDLVFARPPAWASVWRVSGRGAAVSRLLYVCKQEGVAVEKAAVEELVEATNGDIRQVACGWPADGVVPEQAANGHLHCPGDSSGECSGDCPGDWSSDWSGDSSDDCSGDCPGECPGDCPGECSGDCPGNCQVTHTLRSRDSEGTTSFLRSGHGNTTKRPSP